MVSRSVNDRALDAGEFDEQRTHEEPAASALPLTNEAASAEALTQPAARHRSTHRTDFRRGPTRELCFSSICNSQLD